MISLGEEIPLCKVATTSDLQEMESNITSILSSQFSLIHRRLEEVSNVHKTTYPENTIENLTEHPNNTLENDHLRLKLNENEKMNIFLQKEVDDLMNIINLKITSSPYSFNTPTKENPQNIDIVYSYLKRRKQNVKIDNIFSFFKTLLSGVPQGSILGPILFIIFLNDLLDNLKNSDLYNFADDNTISPVSNSKTGLIKTEYESNIAVKWFRENEMIVTSDKFQAMFLETTNENSNFCNLQIDNNEIETTNSVKLLGITIDSKLNFDSHISDLCNKASMQLNALNRLRKYIGEKQMEILLNSFIYSNFNYCPLV